MSTHVPVETTPENIRAIAAELRRCGVELEAAAQGIADAGFGELKVVNFGVLKKSVFGANSYVKAVKDAIWNEREKRGDFGTAPNGRPAKTTRRGGNK